MDYVSVFMSWLPIYLGIAVLLFLQWLAIRKGVLVSVEYSKKERLSLAIVVFSILAMSYSSNDNLLFLLFGFVAAVVVYSRKKFYKLRLKKS